MDGGRKEDKHLFLHLSRGDLGESDIVRPSILVAIYTKTEPGTERRRRKKER
jgi:hypothetical protein